MQDGPELREIQTDQLGFKAINGDSKVRLLPSPWPTDALPPPSSSLFALASRKGWVAAAGPDALVFTNTEKLREAFRVDKTSDNNLRPFQADLSISVPRLGQVVFSADENVLLVSAQDSGGIAAYSVESLQNGNTSPQVQVSTNNTSLRALVPNPAPDSAKLVAAVTSNGELLIADLQAGTLQAGSSGPVLKSGVSCLSWSNKGKQLVAGLADGTATQMKPDGSIVTEIPKSTSIPNDMHISAISWLENDSFLAVYTPNDTTSDGMMPSSEYYIISREKGTNSHLFQKLPEACPPFGMERLPAFQFISRLRKFEPNLQDLLILAATNSPDVVMLTKADSPLSSEEKVIGEFTLTMMGDDSRRAQLPLADSGGDTSVIGMGVDLSSKETVALPIPSDPEIQETEIPLPSIFVLNHEGVLMNWWVIHEGAIRARTQYPAMASSTSVNNDMQTSAMNETKAQPLNTATSTPFAQPSFGFTGSGKPSATPEPASASLFGNTSSSTFGQSSTIGGVKPSWTSTGFDSSAQSQGASSAFGKPGFGSSSTPNGAAAPAFGSTGFGNRASAFGKPSVGSASQFGQAGFGGSIGSPFANASSSSPFTNRPSSSGFASFSNKDETSGFGSTTKEPGSLAEKPSASLFGKSEEPNRFEARPEKSPFATNQSTSQEYGSGDFRLGSSFRKDETSKDTAISDEGGSTFGGFGSDLPDTNAALSLTHDKEEEMGDDEAVDERDASRLEVDQLQKHKPHAQSMITPPSTMIHHKQTPAPPLSGLFGTSDQPQSTTPAAPSGTGWAFGNLPSTTPKDTPDPSKVTVFGIKTLDNASPAVAQKSEPSKLFEDIKPSKQGNYDAITEDGSEAAPQIKEERPSDDESTDLRNIPEAPLPPDPVSKTAYSPGDTSTNSSNNSKDSSEDAPLPPDFLPANKTAAGNNEAPELPEDEEEFSSDFDGSVEDGNGDISPIEENEEDQTQTEQILTSPESSFGRGNKTSEASPTGGVFTKVTTSSKAAPKPLFGEISSNSFFPPPIPQESPRSPSPIRQTAPLELLRPETSRSVSAPGRAPVLDRRKAEIAKSPMAQQAAREREMLEAREQARAGALAKIKAEAEAEAARELEYDSDEEIRNHLQEPVEPSETLEAFLPLNESPDTPKAGIPGQIERLYKDLNSTISTIGMNARTLSSYMLYQQQHQVDLDWPDVLASEEPSDALDTDWDLSDISQLHESNKTLSSLLSPLEITDYIEKLRAYQTLYLETVGLQKTIEHLRKATRIRADTTVTTSAPLSAAQASLQHDLRKSATSVQTKLIDLEAKLSILRAKLSEREPTTTRHAVNELKSSRIGASHNASAKKKPTLEAVTKTIEKLTAMAERKSADIDVLESQLRRLNVASTQNDEDPSDARFSTPDGKRRAMPEEMRSSLGARSGSGSVYHTPESRFGGSPRSTGGGSARRSLGPAGAAGGKSLVSKAERERWLAKAKREKEVKDLVREVLGRSAR